MVGRREPGAKVSNEYDNTQVYFFTVNLRTHVQEGRYAIPKKRRYRLKTILLKTEFLLDYFHDMVKKSNTHDSSKILTFLQCITGFAANRLTNYLVTL